MPRPRRQIHNRYRFWQSLVSLEVFNCSPQPLKAGIVATALFRRFMEYVYIYIYIYRYMYVQPEVHHCWHFGGLLCLLADPISSLCMIPCTLANPKRTGWGPGRQGPCAYSRIHGSALHVHMPWATRHPAEPGSAYGIQLLAGPLWFPAECVRVMLTGFPIQRGSAARSEKLLGAPDRNHLCPAGGRGC